MVQAGGQDPVKASIWDEDATPQAAQVVTFMFNPEQYSVTKTNSWTREPQREQDIPLIQFGAGGDTTLSLQNLTFDTYGASPAVDVRTHTNKVFDLMKIDTELRRPRRVSFRWKGGYFRSVITSVTQTLTLFATDGTPVRARLNLDLLKVAEGTDTDQGTNPTSVARAYKVRTVLQGETLDTIAYQEYGDARKWPMIADFNRLADPLRLRPGQRLAIPPIR